ncbi:MAG: threonine ammonia-lyase, biosynthetic, partial [Sphingobacteriaceae bacterium]
FLERLGQQFNISLFHYRNHGAAEGRVLMGLQLGSHQRSVLNAALDTIGYPYEDITNNAGYQLFLK